MLGQPKVHRLEVGRAQNERHREEVDALLHGEVDPPQISRRQSKKLGYTFPLLSDPKGKVIRRYDVLHPAAGPKGADIARPAEFLIGSGRMVRWVNLTGNIAVRARPEQVLSAFNQIEATGQ